MGLGRDAKKISRQMRAKRVKKQLIYWVTALSVTFLAVIGIITWMLLSDRFLIHDISVVGNNVVPEENIKMSVEQVVSGAYLFVFPKNNSFIYPRTDIKNTLRAHESRIKNVETQIEDLETLRITIEEYEPEYLWCGPDMAQAGHRPCYFVDREGYIFAEAPTFSSGVFFTFYAPVSGSGSPIRQSLWNDELFVRLQLFKEAVENRNFVPVALQDISGGDFEMYLQDSGKIIFNIDQDSSKLLNNLSTAFENIPAGEKIDYVDLRFGNKIFYKEKEEIK